MNFLARWLERRRVDRELADEMAAHLEERTAELMEEGQSEAEARANARRRFGNLTLEREKSREAWGWTAVEQLLQDVRFGCRVLVKTPAFSVTAVVVLALGIGMNTAMFSAVNAVLLSALPYPHPERLVQVWQTAKSGHTMSVSGLDFRDWRAQNRSMEYLASYGDEDVTLAGKFAPKRVHMGMVSRGFFEAMGTGAVVGRTFSRAEQTPGGTPTAVVGYELSQAIFGPGAEGLGKAIRIDGMTFTVIGVMPPRFNFPGRAEVWTPAEFFKDDTGRSAHNNRVIGRLRQGVSIRRAQGDMDLIAARLGKEYKDDKDEGIRVVSLYEQIVGPVRPAFLMLLSAVVLVLLIACVNISNLQMARATVRIRELALRKALGAARGRLVRQLLTESVLLSLVGGAAGLLLALLGTAFLRHSAPADIPRMENMRVDTTVLWFTAALSMAAGILFGVLPAIVGSRSDANEALKEGGSKSTAGPQLKRWGNGLVVGQIALAIVLLAGAVLLMKSYWKLAHVNSGLKASGVYTADVTWPAANGNPKSAEVVTTLSRELLERVSKLPGIQAAALINPLPVRDGGADGNFEIEGRPQPADPHESPDAYYRLATSEYFSGVRIANSEGARVRCAR